MWESERTIVDFIYTYIFYSSSFSSFHSFSICVLYSFNFWIGLKSTTFVSSSSSCCNVRMDFSSTNYTAALLICGICEFVSIKSHCRWPFNLIFNNLNCWQCWNWKIRENVLSELLSWLFHHNQPHHRDVATEWKSKRAVGMEFRQWIGKMHFDFGFPQNTHNENMRNNGNFRGNSLVNNSINYNFGFLYISHLIFVRIIHEYRK